MYTAFITDAKTTLSELWEQVQKIHAAQTRNADSKVYTPDYTDSENKKLEQQKKDACNAARERIAAIMDKATEDAATLDALTPLDIDPDSKADRRIMELLSGKFSLNAAQLQALLDKFIPKDNRALLNAVKTYCEVRGMRLIAADTVSRRSGIKSIRESALGLVSRIEATSYKNQGKEYDVPLMVRDFCVDGAFAAATGIYDKIGQKYSGELVPARVEPENGGLDLHFQSVRDADKKAG